MHLSYPQAAFSQRPATSLVPFNDGRAQARHHQVSGTLELPAVSAAPSGGPFWRHPRPHRCLAPGLPSLGSGCASLLNPCLRRHRTQHHRAQRSIWRSCSPRLEPWGGCAGAHLATTASHRAAGDRSSCRIHARQPAGAEAGSPPRPAWWPHGPGDCLPAPLQEHRLPLVDCRRVRPWPAHSCPLCLVRIPLTGCTRCCRRQPRCTPSPRCRAACTPPPTQARTLWSWACSPAWPLGPGTHCHAPGRAAAESCHTQLAQHLAAVRCTRARRCGAGAAPGQAQQLPVQPGRHRSGPVAGGERLSCHTGPAAEGIPQLQCGHPRVQRAGQAAIDSRASGLMRYVPQDHVCTCTTLAQRPRQCICV